MQFSPERKVVALAFEASRDEDHEIIDAVRTIMLGEFELRGGYVTSNRFVVHAKVSDEEAARWAEAKKGE